MDSDSWISRLLASKRNNLQQEQQNSNSDRFEDDEFDLEEEIRLDFPCPICNEGFEITSMCSHLEDVHPFESKDVACPICSVKVAGDMPNHIMLQHGDSSRISFPEIFYQ